MTIRSGLYQDFGGMVCFDEEEIHAIDMYAARFTHDEKPFRSADAFSSLAQHSTKFAHLTGNKTHGEAAMKKNLMIGVIVGSLAALCACGTIAGEEDIQAPDPGSSNNGSPIDEKTEAELGIADEIKPLLDPSIPDNRQQIQNSKQENRRVVGWFSVPGTDIDTPILQHIRDNNYYTERDFYDRVDSEGTFFADFRSELATGWIGDFSRITTLYGHSFSEDPQGGGMMSPIKSYRDMEFAREHPYLYFSTEQQALTWEIIAVFDAHVALPYIVPDLDEDDHESLLSVIADSSYYHYDAFDAVSIHDKLLVATCCTYQPVGMEVAIDDQFTDYRFAIMARLVTEGETPKDSAALTKNQAPLFPDEAVRVYQQLSKTTAE